MSAARTRQTRRLGDPAAAGRPASRGRSIRCPTGPVTDRLGSAGRGQQTSLLHGKDYRGSYKHHDGNIILHVKSHCTRRRLDKRGASTRLAARPRPSARPSPARPGPCPTGCAVRGRNPSPCSPGRRWPRRDADRAPSALHPPGLGPRPGHAAGPGSWRREWAAEVGGGEGGGGVATQQPGVRRV